MALREGEVWGEVTEASLKRLLERKGVVRETRGSMFRLNQAVERKEEWKPRYAKMRISAEANRRVATGIADLNPLYINPDYAAKSPWGRMITPPASLCWTELVNGATDGFPGCHTIWRGVEYEWERPIYVDEAVGSRTWLSDARIVESRFGGGRSAIQNYDTQAYSMDGEYIGTYRTSWHRFSRKRAQESSKYGGVERHQWTDEELEAVWDEYRNYNKKNRRGKTPLYWEEVEEGVEIPHIIKGPITLTSKIAYESAMGSGGWVVGHELALDLWDNFPRLPIRNEENVPEPPVAIHWTNERCQRYLGMPGAYEAGFERLNWLTQLIMSWMGDHGKFRKLSVEFKGFHWQGDAIRLFAKVTGKRVEEGRHLVDLDVWCRSHPRDEITTAGKLVVELPSRGSAV